MEAFILRAVVSFMLRRAESGGQDKTFSSVNYFCASKISLDRDIRIKTCESYSIKTTVPPQKNSHID